LFQEKDNKLRLPADRSNEIECQSDYGNPLPRIEWFIDGENVTQNVNFVITVFALI
jgi:hypothetical protein